ncbi:hypothetical protein PYW08_003726 [Mythimna loreyi]|uniref:Uncharacterized protein n=1 Tax=Mythimna loreyi TaxID=667449 RepID=A0ACC2QUH1_9NEOP|nr:hypothetical protein PYW08_003726 [Mythimna loreyi]
MGVRFNNFLLMPSLTACKALFKFSVSYILRRCIALGFFLDLSVVIFGFMVKKVGYTENKTITYVKMTNLLAHLWPIIGGSANILEFDHFCNTNCWHLDKIIKTIKTMEKNMTKT